MTIMPRPVVSVQPPSRQGLLLVRKPQLDKKLAALEIRRLSLLREKKKGTSALATLAVSRDTRTDYARRIGHFETWAEGEDCKVVYQLHDDLDLLLAEYMDFLYLEQSQTSDAGSKLLAAVQDKVPSLSNAQDRGLLGISFRALQGWSKANPPGIGETLPGEAVSGIVAELKRAGENEAALMTYLAFDTLLRPAMIATLQVEDIVPGSKHLTEFQTTMILVNPYSRRVPSKTGLWNLSVALDTPGGGWLTKLLLDLRARRKARGSLFLIT